MSKYDNIATVETANKVKTEVTETNDKIKKEPEETHKIKTKEAEMIERNAAEHTEWLLQQPSQKMARIEEQNLRRCNGLLHRQNTQFAQRQKQRENQKQKEMRNKNTSWFK